MNTSAVLARLIENLIRIGTIAAVDLPAKRVRVQSGGLLTGWLPWLAPRAGTAQVWDPPTTGEQVLLLSPSGQTANGVVITGLFSRLVVPVDAGEGGEGQGGGDTLGPGLHRRTYSDGAVVDYDSTAHILRAQLPAGGSFALVGDVSIEGNLNVSKQIDAGIDTVAAGISLVGHVHGGVKQGEDASGAPQ